MADNHMCQVHIFNLNMTANTIYKNNADLTNDEDMIDSKNEETMRLLRYPDFQQ